MGWPMMLLQVVTVMAAYLLASVLAFIPMGAMGIDLTAGPEAIPSFWLAMSVIASAIGGLLVAWAWLAREGRVRAVWDFSAPESWRTTLLWAGAGLIGTILLFSLGSIALEALGFPPPDASLILNAVTESPLMFAIWVSGVAIFAAGLGEELLWRGFLMDRLSRVAGLRGRWTLILIIQAVLFGLPHIYQGLGGVLLTGLIGLLFGVIRIMQKGNLWAVFIAHATYDTLAMTLVYTENAGWLGG
ncbi:hypothetical protein AAW01_10010 [Aurantiacibacter gangjinensis]|uniref:CAAX prenyl protease 2/Lysostaphin resistance protein A-like domain-containing protein n=2 Tax=Aurantiacibacter gangjinensis TaxID=502682 RepID=A0A0G9MNG5_9SPHN|nr:hypothetical protein AAW01_10010 [Aurantiacibacter gangjinensis]